LSKGTPCEIARPLPARPSSVTIPAALTWQVDTAAKAGADALPVCSATIV